MSENKKFSPPSTSNLKPASSPALPKDQLKGLLIDFMGQLAANPPTTQQQAEMQNFGFTPSDAENTPARITDEAEGPKYEKSEKPALANIPRSSETTTGTPPDGSTTPKSPRLKEETLHGVRFVNESNPCPSSELIGGILSNVYDVPGPDLSDAECAAGIGLDPDEPLSQIQRYAVELKRRMARKSQTGTDADLIVEPLECDLTGHSNSRTLLLRWCYFNPYGPTLVSLFHTPVPGSSVALFSCLSHNPFSVNHSAYGLVKGPGVWADVKSAVLHLFCLDGFAKDLPTSIVFRENWTDDEEADQEECPLLGRDDACGAFSLAAVDTPTGDLKLASEFFRRYPDPWERVEAEMNHALKEMISMQKDGGTRPEPESDCEVYQEWFDLVTEQEHVLSERDNFGPAWAGALKYANHRIN